MYYVKIIEEGVLKKHIITGQENKVVTIPQNVHTVVGHCFDPWYPEPISAENIDDLYNWDSFCMIEKMIIPESIKHIERYAFMGLPNLKEFEVEEGCCAAKVYDDSLFSKDGKLLLCCPPQKQGDFTIPYGVETICENAFDGTNLSCVFLSSSVKAIEDDAFACGHNLEEIYIPSSVTDIGDRAFEGCYAI